jgi:hypothetical protein
LLNKRLLIIGKWLDIHGYKINKWRLGQDHTGKGDRNPGRPKCLPHDPGHGWWWQKEMGERDTFPKGVCMVPSGETGLWPWGCLGTWNPP